MKSAIVCHFIIWHKDSTPRTYRNIYCIHFQKVACKIHIHVLKRKKNAQESKIKQQKDAMTSGKKNFPN